MRISFSTNEELIAFMEGMLKTLCADKRVKKGFAKGSGVEHDVQVFMFLKPFRDRELAGVAQKKPTPAMELMDRHERTKSIMRQIKAGLEEQDREKQQKLLLGALTAIEKMVSAEKDPRRSLEEFQKLYGEGQLLNPHMEFLGGFFQGLHNAYDRLHREMERQNFERAEQKLKELQDLNDLQKDEKQALLKECREQALEFSELETAQETLESEIDRLEEEADQLENAPNESLRRQQEMEEAQRRLKEFERSMKKFRERMERMEKLCQELEDLEAYHKEFESAKAEQQRYMEEFKKQQQKLETEQQRMKGLEKDRNRLSLLMKKKSLQDNYELYADNLAAEARLENCLKEMESFFEKSGVADDLTAILKRAKKGEPLPADAAAAVQMYSFLKEELLMLAFPDPKEREKARRELEDNLELPSGERKRKNVLDRADADEHPGKSFIQAFRKEITDAMKAYHSKAEKAMAAMEKDHAEVEALSAKLYAEEKKPDRTAELRSKTAELSVQAQEAGKNKDEAAKKYADLLGAHDKAFDEKPEDRLRKPEAFPELEKLVLGKRDALRIKDGQLKADPDFQKLKQRLKEAQDAYQKSLPENIRKEAQNKREQAAAKKQKDETIKSLVRKKKNLNKREKQIVALENEIAQDFGELRGKSCAAAIKDSLELLFLGLNVDSKDKNSPEFDKLVEETLKATAVFGSLPQDKVQQQAALAAVKAAAEKYESVKAGQFHFFGGGSLGKYRREVAGSLASFCETAMDMVEHFDPRELQIERNLSTFFDSPRVQARQKSFSEAIKSFEANMKKDINSPVNKVDLKVRTKSLI